MISRKDLLKECNPKNKFETFLKMADTRVRQVAEKGIRHCTFFIQHPLEIPEEDIVQEFIQLGYKILVYRCGNGNYYIELYW